MAQAQLTLALDAALQDRIEAGAREAGMSPEDFAARLLNDQLVGSANWDWSPENPFSSADPQPDGAPVFELAETLREFHQELEARLTNK
jgi:hypothetical protein